jgi:hypothetical protein
MGDMMIRDVKMVAPLKIDQLEGLENIVVSHRKGKFICVVKTDKTIDMGVVIGSIPTRFSSEGERARVKPPICDNLTRFKIELPRGDVEFILGRDIDVPEKGHLRKGGRTEKLETQYSNPSWKELIHKQVILTWLGLN